jgi:LCP family protein required for cell wall assembly
MSSDYNRWKKRRDAERARREQDIQEPRRGYSPPPARSSERQAPYYDDREDEPRRAYQGYIPPAPPASPATRRQGGGTARGCLGCATLLLGILALLVLAGLIGGVFYWRQIEQRGQVNVLFMGIDARPTEAPPFRSDSMIMVGFRPRQREVALLTIPRDLWLAIPGFGDNRINTAHFFGGPPLAMQAVRENFGVPVHYYMRLDFEGFVSIVDALGGITVDVPETLIDDEYPTPDYGVTTIQIPAGVQQMDGETALIYARTRHGTSDLDRSLRQQQLIAAIRDELAHPRAWLRAPRIFSAASGSISTNIPRNEWPALALILVRSNIERAPIGPEAVQPHVTAEGAWVLLPVWEQINPALARYFE